MPLSSAGANVADLLASGALTGEWTLDGTRSTISLRTRSMWGMVTVKGQFDSVSGNATVTATGEVTGKLIIEAASINTKSRKRDTHLRSADFLNSAQYPQIIFTLAGVQSTANAIMASGTLQVRDTTRPLSFPVVVTEPTGREMKLEAKVEIERDNFGLSWNQLGMASMNNEMSICAVFVRK